MPFQSHLRDFSTARAFSRAHDCALECAECSKRQPALITAVRRMERVLPEALTCLQSRSSSSLADVKLGAEREAFSDGRL